MKPCLSVLTVIVIVYTACRTKPADPAGLKAINQSLENSNKTIANSNMLSYNRLVDYVQDYREEKTRYWMAIAGTVQQTTENMLMGIDSLKDVIINHGGIQSFQQNNGGALLFSHLTAYKNKLRTLIKPEAFANDGFWLTHLKREVQHMNESLPVTAAFITDSTFDVSLFNHATDLSAQTLLNKIKNDILVSEGMFIDFCSLNTIRGSCGSTGAFQGIATLNSSYLQKGQTLEISAGVGVFSASLNPVITIAGKKIPLDKDGVGVYRIKISQPPGKYTIPVSFSHYKPDGTDATYTKNLYYTIAE